MSILTKERLLIILLIIKQFLQNYTQNHYCIGYQIFILSPQSVQERPVFELFSPNNLAKPSNQVIRMVFSQPQQYFGVLGKQNPRVYSAGPPEALCTFPFLSHQRRGCCKLFLRASVVIIDGEVE
ncbi:Hypothetical_protein [Hexamita inflata]|uniref:Hypothetical_protein n=1 Tax=Hexamita inflata TaxID=28002 RepID=A0ABP1HM67_9EUKA